MRQKIIIAFLLLSFFRCELFAQETGRKWPGPDESPSLVIEEDTIQDPFTGTKFDREWWTVFGYTQLNKLQALALAGNYDIKVLENRVLESKARVQATASALFPSVSFNPSFIRQEFSGTRPVGFDIDVPQIRLNTYSVPIDLNYEVDVFGRISHQTRASRFELEATQASRDDVVLTVTAEVARNYFLLITLDTELDILKRTLNTRQDNLEIVEIRYDAGLVNEIDLQRARTELASIEVQVESNRLQRTEIELVLAILCGQEPQEFRVPETRLTYQPPQVYTDPPATLDQRRPDLLQAAYELQSFEQRLKSARKELYPSLLLQGSFGYLSESTDALLENQSRNWLVGGTVAIPLFDGFRRRANIKIADQQLEAAENRQQQQTLRAQQEVENARSNLARLRQQLIAQQAFQQAARQAAELSKERYTKGLVTYLEVVDAERIYLDAERLSVQLLGRQLITTVTLIQAIGGGYP